MIKYKIGDLFTEDAEALVNTVNCVGVMGRGVAYQFKVSFPANYKAYKAACDRHLVQPGKMFVYETGQLEGPRLIINFPTKRHWRGKSRIEDIEVGLQSLRREIEDRDIRSIALPPLGSGLGGLNWRIVRNLIEDALGDCVDREVVVYEPHETEEVIDRNPSTDVPNMTNGRAVLVCLMRRYTDGLLDPFISLLEIHKLMYLTQFAGERLNLRFKPAKFGPYAENLRHLLLRLEGHLITGYSDGGDYPLKSIELLPGAYEDATAHLKDQSESNSRLEKVAELVDGFESPFGLELLTTVHWVATNSSIDSDHDLVDAIYAWDSRKRQFSERQISVAASVLRERGWLGDISAN